jgi:hypothetical protein
MAKEKLHILPLGACRDWPLMVSFGTNGRIKPGRWREETP